MLLKLAIIIVVPIIERIEIATMIEASTQIVELVMQIIITIIEMVLMALQCEL